MPGQRFGELLAAPMTGTFCRRFAVHLRRQATQMDEAREEAVRQAVQLAEEEERSRQYRIVHDSAIQVLEAVAGGWEVDEDVLLARIDFEIERLKRVVSGGGLIEGGSLRDALVYLAEEFRLSGIEIVLDVDRLRGPYSLAATQALANAAHEALVNVRKHSGVTSARLEATDEDDGVVVVIADEGRGFDPSAPRRGFGLDESIGAGIAAVGGLVDILAGEGTGTTIRLRVPQVRSSAADVPPTNA
jgi:signal transduction histidine kinase